MLAQKIILGFGFAVVLPLLVHYGIEAFHPSVPTPESYDEVRRLRQREEQSTGDEKVQLRDQRERMEAELRTQERASSRLHFFVGAPIGVAEAAADRLRADERPDHGRARSCTASRPTRACRPPSGGCVPSSCAPKPPSSRSRSQATWRRSRSASSSTAG